MDFAGKKSYGFSDITLKRVGGGITVKYNIILLMGLKLVFY